MGAQRKKIIKNDVYSALKQYTDARIAIGRAGCSVPLKEMLEFKMSHAHARDEVFSVLKTANLLEQLSAFGLGTVVLSSQAEDREMYIKRPDLGRKLSTNSFIKLNDSASVGYDVSIILADGLSASAINNHAIPFLNELLPELKLIEMRIAPVVLVENGRVAIADEIGFLLKARLSLILIGERPGLTSPDSMGAYLTYNPQSGLKDDSRNCVSNIRLGGLDYGLAGEKVFFLIKEAFRRKLSGVGLKEEFDTLLNEKEDNRGESSS